MEKAIDLDRLRRAYRGKSTLLVARGMRILRRLQHGTATIEELRRPDYLTASQAHRAIRVAREILDGSRWHLECDGVYFLTKW